MTVYVDGYRALLGRMKMCHMVADTEAELHEMADRIGLVRRWYQADASYPHYDVALSKRALAVSAGAKELTLREMGLLIRRLRAAGAGER